MFGVKITLNNADEDQNNLSLGIAEFKKINTKKNADKKVTNRSF